MESFFSFQRWYYDLLDWKLLVVRYRFHTPFNNKKIQQLEKRGSQKLMCIWKSSPSTSTMIQKESIKVVRLVSRAVNAKKYWLQSTVLQTLRYERITDQWSAFLFSSTQVYCRSRTINSHHKSQCNWKQERMEKGIIRIVEVLNYFGGYIRLMTCCEMNHLENQTFVLLYHSNPWECLTT